MQLINIHNRGRFVYLFKRAENGRLSIEKDTSFFPYFYEPDEQGTYIGYDGTKLKKVFCSSPRDVPKTRTTEAYEADIIFTRRYLIDKVDKLEKCPIKYCFIDIEVLSDELPNVTKADKLVSCITVYNSWYDEYKTWYLGDYGNATKVAEQMILEEFIKYMKEEQFDLWLSWNVNFDYDYLFNRIKRFPDKISAIGQSRYGHDKVFYPAGIGIVDYLGWDKKVTLGRRRSYALDNVAQDELGEESWERGEFGKLNEGIKEKNINDVKRMVALEKKLKYIQYFDEIRRLSKVEWEDMTWNSRIIDMLLLQEAKKQNVILPMKPKGLEKEEYEGAYRCYSEDTEILTLEGWKRYTELEIGESVASVNILSNRIEFQSLLHKSVYKVNNISMCLFQNQYTNQLLTQNHKVLYKKNMYSLKGKYISSWKTCFAKDFTFHHTLLPLSLPMKDKKDYNISDELLKIHAWIITEGSNKKGEQRLKNNFYIISQSLKVNPEHCKEIDILFNSLNWEISKNINTITQEIKWNLKVKYSKKIKLEENHKIIPLWILQNCSFRQLTLFYNELMKGDGDKARERYNAKDRLARDRFQYLATLLGKRSANHNEKTVNCNSKNLTDLQGQKKKDIPYTGIIWCPTVKNGFVVMRRRGKVFISGNSAYELGAFQGITKYDLSSAYPFAIIDFCLDPSNIYPQNYPPTHITRKGFLNIEDNCFHQNSDALLPTIVKQLIDLKSQTKQEVKKTPVDSENYTDICKKYDATKSVVNSAYGVMGNRYFRLYDKRVASATAFIVRDVLHYVKDRLERDLGLKVIYVDTDSVFVKTGNVITAVLNNLVKEWAQEKYRKNTSIEFEYEGMFEKLLILAKCRYKGYVKNAKGELKPEIKGIEAKRKDSSRFMAHFQTILMDKIMDKEPKPKIISWIKGEISRIKTVPIEDIAFPCKLARRPEEYKNTPIFVRALNNTNKFALFHKKVGDIFYYIYTLPLLEKISTQIYIDGELYEELDIDLKRKEALNRLLEKGIDVKAHKINVHHSKECVDVLAFDEKKKEHVQNIDWKLMTQRNILNKVQVIFDALGWQIQEVML